jgi:alpha-L-fucosidase
MYMPDGIKTIADANKFHAANDAHWHEERPPWPPQFAQNWFLRCQDLVDTYKPDLLYFDDSELPLGQYGLDIAAHYYNSSVRDKGKVDVVLTAKDIKPEQAGAFTLDIERGKTNGILDQPWQTDTCIGNWHYDIPSSRTTSTRRPPPSSIAHRHRQQKRQPDAQHPHQGRRHLSTPTSAPSSRHRHLDSQARRGHLRHTPLHVFGEGPPDIVSGQLQREVTARPTPPKTSASPRKGDTLYAFAFVWPDRRQAAPSRPSPGATPAGKPIQRVDLIGAGSLTFAQDATGLTLNLPDKAPNPYAYAFILRTRS